MAAGLLGNERPDSNRFIHMVPKPENGVRLYATLGNQNPTGLPVGAVSISKSREQNLPLFIYEGANHSLETADTMRNINNIMDVMEKTKSYLM